jgi:Prokaryotic RING finger family 1
MELVILGLVVLFLYISIRALSTFSAWVTGRRYQAYRNLAARYRGKYESRGLSDPPTVSFLYNGSTVRVGLAPTIAGQPGQIPRTRVVARFGKGIPFRMELAPVCRPAPPQPPRGTRTVRLRDRDFAATYTVQANDEEMARDFLTSDVRYSVELLQKTVHPGGMLVSINPERLLVQVDRNLGQSGEALAQAVREALVIHDGLLDGVHRRMSQGIAIVDRPGAPDEDAGPPICKVCGEPIDAGDAVVCASCNTPHHRDCWEYVGACSIYGCNGKVGVTE